MLQFPHSLLIYSSKPTPFSSEQTYIAKAPPSLLWIIDWPLPLGQCVFHRWLQQHPCSSCTSVTHPIASILLCSHKSLWDFGASLKWSAGVFPIYFTGVLSWKGVLFLWAQWTMRSPVPPELVLENKSVWGGARSGSVWASSLCMNKLSGKRTLLPRPCHLRACESDTDCRSPSHYSWPTGTEQGVAILR